MGPLCTDADNDGLTDCEEAGLGTNPTLWDSDGDGIGDGMEVDDGTIALDDTDFTPKAEVWVEIGRTGVEKDTLAEPNTIGIYYYHPNGGDRGWYPAENVLGWLVPDSALTLDLNGTRSLGLLVRHAAIIHVGSPSGP